ncbi:MAG: hypothetical protein F6K19_51035, partial [Cyanothece sp. SIO1E1]|nr:hypothetical protein [Cyanothece sp. SIO1E1]
MSERQPGFRPVNHILGAQPRLGPIPAEQIIPWTSMIGIAYLIGRGLGLDWLMIGLIAAWGIATWWILTGGKNWKFLAKFVPTPTWSRSHPARRVLLGNHENQSR